MSDTGTDPDEAADALAALADETRLAILRELADADAPLSFSTLRERVGVRDTGRFNYHLTELCGYFVRDVDGGYELGYAGDRVVAAADGAAGDPTTVRPAGDDEECPVCGDRDCDRLFHVHLRPPWRG